MVWPRQAERIHLRTDFDTLCLNMDAAVPCRLIINELVSNSPKYAFPDGRPGEIRMELHERVEADNGVGLMSDIDWVTARSLGLRLVRTLPEQPEAKIEIEAKSGTEVRLTFAAAGRGAGAFACQSELSKEHRLAVRSASY